ncbi:NADH-quinone oxidoreductase subunit M [Taibaiella sp. KBW10]|uniref:complex I subunit 4 family protein n=1 Tax=Taibaiella sp. KBW10 TaxID=2153357 RepID=UPI000F599AD5|nr:NADH-quinone oxidoreductase subunit M [Taibaiella sp. KBW10]RQO31681.1 NADH-quinone oxidoreductase subunit M [Taibaiella sp. KBW10]
MLLILLLVIPLVTGLASFAFRKTPAVKTWALIGALATLVVAALSFCGIKESIPEANYNWLPSLGANFSLQGSVMALLMTLLTAIVFPLVFIAQWNKDIEQPSRFYGLMLLAQSGLMGVFLANDLLLFYFFWELALIPVYFLAGQWGGKDRIKTSFKFFVYTFLGSLLMLAGLIYLYIQTPNGSFDYNTILATGASLPIASQGTLFILFFIAFGIKMPIFPLHSWQASAYEQTLTPVTIVLSALMVKMGLFGVMKWLYPVFPHVDEQFYNIIMILALIGILYGSLLAIVQTDIKRLVAYSSLAHVGLMIMGIFAQTENATNGVITQMFNHGITITGLWLVVDMIERRYQTRDLASLGGLAGAAPKMTIALVVITFSSIALPLTNGFVGEFLLFLGIFESTNPNHITFMVLAGLGIILGAIYMLNMVQKVAYGEQKSLVIADMSLNEKISIYIILIVIVVLGVYPNLLLQVL